MTVLAYDILAYKIHMTVLFEILYICDIIIAYKRIIVKETGIFMYKKKQGQDYYTN